MMTKEERFEMNALGELVIEIFRLNGVLLAEGDKLTRDVGLTSARWQVLGAIEVAGRPLTVAEIARNMGLTRQSVQRLANELEGERLVAFAENPNHRRAKLVVPTEKGRRAFRGAMRRQADWAKATMRRSRIGERQLREAERALRALRLALSGTEK